MLSAVWNIWLELAPWLLLGAAASGVLHAILPEGWLQRHLSGRFGVLKAVLLGIPLPLCSCGVIPVGLGLRKDGASNGAAVGFLISTPQTGVDSILVSGSMLGWPFAILKVGVALVTGLVGGSLADLSSDSADRQNESVNQEQASTGNRIRLAWAHSVELIRSVWKWLIAGVLVSAAITWLVPERSFQDIALLSGVSALLLTLVLSVPLYVCATASVPIAAALVASGLPPGAALVFLMAGPATNVATIGAVHRTLGLKSLAIYLSTIVVGSVVAGLVFNEVIDPSVAAIHHHHHDATWWRIASAVALLVFIVSFVVEDIRNVLRRHAADDDSRPSTTVSVKGMTCNGCAGKLRRTLEAHSRIAHADVSFEDGKAVVTGDAEAETIRSLVLAAGFEPGDFHNVNAVDC